MYKFSSIPFVAYNLSVRELIHFLIVCILLFVEPLYSYMLLCPLYFLQIAGGIQKLDQIPV